MEKNSKISISVIKVVAMATMFLDHLGYILYKDIPDVAYHILRGIGRFSFPLFAFCLAEGFFYTKSPKKYILRVGIFAVISEVPYNIFCSGNIIKTGSTNVMFTLLIALIVLTLCRYFDGLGRKWTVLSVLSVIAGMFLAYMIKSDYSYRGVALVAVIYYTRFNLYARYAGATAILWSKGELEALVAPLAFVLTHFYNGEKGKLNKWVCYGFYPIQLMILGLLGRYI